MQPSFHKSSNLFVFSNFLVAHDMVKDDQDKENTYCVIPMSLQLSNSHWNNIK